MLKSFLIVGLYFGAFGDLFFQLFVFLLQFGNLHLVNIFDDPYFFIKPLNLGNLNLLFLIICFWVPLCIPLGCQLPASNLPVVLVINYLLSQLLFDSGHFYESFIQRVILLFEILDGGFSLVSFEFPKLFLIVLWGVALIVIVAIFDCSDGACHLLLITVYRF